MSKTQLFDLDGKIAFVSIIPDQRTLVARIDEVIKAKV